MSHVRPAIAASVVPPIIFLLGVGVVGIYESVSLKIEFLGFLVFFVIAWVISCGHMIIYMLLAITVEESFGLNVLKCTLIGLFVGGLFVGFETWPYSGSHYSKEVEAEFMGMKVIAANNGFLTLWGWLIYLKAPLISGTIFGAPSGFVYGLYYEKN